MPWNYPFHNIFNPLSAALFAGNAIVIKARRAALGRAGEGQRGGAFAARLAAGLIVSGLLAALRPAGVLSLSMHSQYLCRLQSTTCWHPGLPAHSRQRSAPANAPPQVSEHASWSALRYKRIIDAALAAVGAPADLVQIVTGGWAGGRSQGCRVGQGPAARAWAGGQRQGAARRVPSLSPCCHGLGRGMH